MTEKRVVSVSILAKECQKLSVLKIENMENVIDLETGYFAKWNSIQFFPFSQWLNGHIQEYI